MNADLWTSASRALPLPRVNIIVRTYVFHMIKNICHDFMKLAYPLTKCTLFVFE